MRHPQLSLRAVPAGEQHITQGEYEYYHYMQDRIDDNVRPAATEAT